VVSWGPGFCFQRCVVQMRAMGGPAQPDKTTEHRVKFACQSRRSAGYGSDGAGEIPGPGVAIINQVSGRFWGVWQCRCGQEERCARSSR
jgi:hypothetical protein